MDRRWSTFRIGPAEWDLLFDEPGDVVKVYMALRQRMDFSTGVVGGPKDRISETYIRETLWVEPIPGRKNAGHKPRQYARSVMDRLKKIGLIEPVGRYVFRLPLAASDRSAQKSNNQATTKQQPKQKPEQQPGGGADKNNTDNNISAVGGDAATTAGTDHHAEHDQSSNPPPDLRDPGVVDTEGAHAGGVPRAGAREDGSPQPDDATDSGGANPTPTEAGRMAKALRPLGIDVTPSNPVLLAWIRDGVTVEQATACAEICRERKPRERIPARYLDAVIRDQGTQQANQRAGPDRPPDKHAARMDFWRQMNDGSTGEQAERVIDGEAKRLG